jgi:Type II intron maturase
VRVPTDVVTAKQAPCRRHGIPWHRPGLLNLDDLQIVRIYGAEYRGIVHYYLLAGNVSRLHRLRRAAELSMLKTLAARHPLHGGEISQQVKGRRRHLARAPDLL